MRLFRYIVAGVCCWGSAIGLEAAELLLCGKDHKAAIVVADDAKRIAQYAARELALHAAKATGVEVPVLSESDAERGDFNSRIFLGLTRAARSAKLETAQLPPESCIIHTVGNDLYLDVGHRWMRFIQFAHEAFPPQCFPPAAQLLDRALDATAGSKPEFEQRVIFLRTGLEHARIAGEVAACFGPDKYIPQDSPKLDLAARKLHQLVAFRREHERSYFADLHYGAASRELRYWDLPPIIKRMDEQSGKAQRVIQADTESYTP